MREWLGKLRRWGTAAWILAIVLFAALHAWHLRADFPNGSPWVCDWAKYTDEGWYGNAAVRAHLFGNWYLAGDFNPAVFLPVWPFAEWVLYFFTGVSVEAARGLAVGCFILSLALAYSLLRQSGPRWMALLGITLAVTSPFLYCFSRMAILEPLETTLILAALNLAVRLPKRKWPVMSSIWIGLLLVLAVLTKAIAAFVAPAIVWAMIVPLRRQRKTAAACALTTVGVAIAGFFAWMGFVARMGLTGDYRYFLVASHFTLPDGYIWPLAAFWWSFHGLLWIDRSLVPMAGALVLTALLAWRTEWSRKLLGDPMFGSALLGTLGFILFMTVQNHPQPRYIMAGAFLLFFVIALGARALLEQTGWARVAGRCVVALAVVAAGFHAAQTVEYAAHPEYTWVNAAARLAHYIDTHPNGKPMLVSVSGDDITFFTHMPTLCDEISFDDLGEKVARYQPGWYASWNDIDPVILAELHTHDSLEQVASFPALDDPDRNVLVLFKLHPLPAGTVRSENDPGMTGILPGDKMDVPVE